ncbi:MAG: FG-GAP repeat domain-containing protein [Armatimonadota bacterium]|jgi:hypothetical protein
MKMRTAIALVLGALIAMTATYAQNGTAQPTENLFANPSFEEGFAERGDLRIPDGWTLYAGTGVGMALEPTDDAHEGETALIVRDGDPNAEIGIQQTIEAEGGIAYEASAMVKALKPGGGAGAYIQLRFLPSNEFEQVSLGSANEAAFRRVSVVGLAPEDTTTVRVYYYTHAGPVPEFIIDAVRLVGGVEPPPPPPPPPPPLDPPVYDTLKDLHLQTELVGDGEARAAIISPGRYTEQAGQIAAAIERITGVRPEIVADDDARAAVPDDGEHLAGSFIVLGNRSTNAMLEQLYNRFFTLLDLRYPGEGGHVVRTCHNPFGGGHNLILVGGSDDAGVAAAAETLIARLEEAGGAQGALSVGWIREIALGDDVEFSHDPEEILHWDASAGYRSIGYFGGNSISKHMAAYYMTGDEYHAREFLRLAFPDEQAKRDITRVDGERIENKDDPLAGPYHYNAHMMILFWDLIEEDPFFSDEDRLRITNAFARHLLHEWREGSAPYALQRPANAVGSRHGQYSALALYCLSRYFAKDYSDPVWRQGLLGSQMAFAPLEEHGWVSGESDNLFWYNTGHAPILRFMLLSGWRGPLESGVLDELLRGQEILATGKSEDWDLRSASITFLHRAAYLKQDGRWLEYLRRTGVNTDPPRVGQSFWPEEHLQPELPMDMVGHWSIHPLPEPMWANRGSGLPLEHSFQFGSFRSAPDATGDFILLDGFNGASRNPYHAFAILELRLGGHTLLKGYRNQVLTRLDGMVEPRVAMDGALRHRDVIGRVAAAVGEVPAAAYCNWRRTLAQRVGEYALVVDELTMTESSENIQVQTLWEAPSGSWDDSRNSIVVTDTPGAHTPVGWRSILALESPYTSHPAGDEHIVRLASHGTLLLRATEPGEWLEMQFALDEPLEGEFHADLLRYTDRGVVRILLDGEEAVERYDSWAATADPARVELGHHRLDAGEHTLRVEVVERGRGGERSNIGLIGLSIRPDEADDAPVEELRREIVYSDPVQTLREGSVFTLEWTGSAVEGETLAFFSVIGSSVSGADEQLASLRLSDNAAVLGLPQPAVAVSGEYQGTDAELAIIAEDHLYARGATAVAADHPLLSADRPVTLDWDFESGTLAVIADANTRLALRIADGEGLALNGQPISAEREGDLLAVEIPAGEHSLSALTPSEAALGGLGEWLGGRQSAAARIRAEAEAIDPPGALPEVPELARVLSADLDRSIAHTMLIPDGAGGQLIATAGGEQITLLRTDGSERAIMETDGPIRVIHWWDDHELLIAGCTDEKVIAFNRDGERQWVYVSEMHPDVFRAAKDYWFKSAYPGIYGLHSGEFIGGESQLFVGSACTLEILDARGQLLEHLAVFWGNGWKFELLDRDDGSRDLLIARWRNGTDQLSIVNSDTLAVTRGFYGVPGGHTMVGGWTAQNRTGIELADVNGDGSQELVSVTNGVWNRVTVFNDRGSPMHNAQFGPGPSSEPYSSMRDLVVADLTGDGMMEIVTATASGLVVCFDHELNRQWARALPSAATVMMAAPAGEGTAVLVACDDGTVALLDASGAVVRTAEIDGRPVRHGMSLLETDDGPIAVIGVAAGGVAGLALQ